MLKSKVPPVAALLVTWALAGCGGEAESASDDASLRVIPPAEAETARPSLEPGAPMDVPETVTPAPDPDPVEEMPVPEAEEDVAPPPMGQPPARAPEAPAGEADAPAETPPDTEADAAPEDARPDPPAAAPVPEPEPLAVPAGYPVELEIQAELSTKDHPAGAPFTATVMEDVLGNGGVVLLPRGSLVRGRVRESRRSPGPDEPAVLTLAPETVEVAGRRLPLVASVTELELEAGTRDSDAETAVKVGAGAAAGAILGKILGGKSRDAVRGAVAGAAAGAAVAALTRDGHAVIPQGARMVMVLDEALILDGG